MGPSLNPLSTVLRKAWIPCKLYCVDPVSVELCSTWAVLGGKLKKNPKALDDMSGFIYLFYCCCFCFYFMRAPA